MIVAFA